MKQPLEVCARCGSPFLIECSEWRVVKCRSCGHLHVVEERWPATGVASMPEVTTISGRADLPDGVAVATRFTPRRVCQWIVQRHEPDLDASLEEQAVNELVHGDGYYVPVATS